MCAQILGEEQKAQGLFGGQDADGETSLLTLCLPNSHSMTTCESAARLVRKTLLIWNYQA